MIDNPRYDAYVYSRAGREQIEFGVSLRRAQIAILTRCPPDHRPVIVAHGVAPTAPHWPDERLTLNQKG